MSVLPGTFRAMTDQIAAPAGSITCPTCGATSHHPRDVAEGYCGACHWWTSDPVLGALGPPAEVVVPSELAQAIAEGLLDADPRRWG